MVRSSDFLAFSFSLFSASHQCVVCLGISTFGNQAGQTAHERMRALSPEEAHAIWTTRVRGVKLATLQAAMTPTGTMPQLEFDPHTKTSQMMVWLGKLVPLETKDKVLRHGKYASLVHVRPPENENRASADARVKKNIANAQKARHLLMNLLRIFNTPDGACGAGWNWS